VVATVGNIPGSLFGKGKSGVEVGRWIVWLFVRGVGLAAANTSMFVRVISPAPAEASKELKAV
jgi:hypothetical protein